MNRLGRMREKPDMPLTPVELFRRGIEITQQIRGRIEETRAYYLGRSSREPAQPLSEVFNPETGPILKYFVQTVRTIPSRSNTSSSQASSRGSSERSTI